MARIKTAGALALDERPAAEPATVEVQPEPTSIQAVLEEAGKRNREAQSAARKAAGTATTKPDAKAKPKAAPKAKAAPKTTAERKPKPAVARVAAERVIALLDELRITRSQLAAATGKSPSLVSEWVGKGRGHLLAEAEWKAVEAAARKFAKGVK